MSRTGPAGRTARWVAAFLLVGAAASARAASLSVQDGPVVLGKTASTSVLFQVDESPGTEDVPLHLSVNVGAFSEPVRIGPGQYRATYRPPSARFPQVALVGIWRETGRADARIEFLRIPLLGVTRVPVTAAPGARVRVRVDRETFGPVIADGRGRAEVPVAVPPGVKACVVTVEERRGRETTRQVPVEVPPYNRLTAAVVPHERVTDGQEVRLYVFYDLGGAEVDPDRIHVRPSLGTVSLESAAGGLHVFRWAAPPGAGVASATFSVSVTGDAAARAVAQITARAPAPAFAPSPPGASARAGAGAPPRVLVTTPAGPLRTGSAGRGVIEIQVLDGAGAGLPGLEVSATANGAPLPPAVARGGGRYEIPFVAPATYPPGGIIRIEAVANLSGGFAFGAANLQLEPPPAPRAVVARVEPSPVPADGRTEARLVLEVRDAAGLPLRGAQLIAVASQGSLGRLEERGGGRYEQPYVGPARLPEVDARLRVVDRAGAYEGTFPIPLRADPGRIQAGLIAGYAASPGAMGPRTGAELWVPLRAGRVAGGAGVAVGLGTAARSVSDATGTLRSDVGATFVPVALKLGWEVYATRRLSILVGAGPVLTLARFKSSLASGTEEGFGLGWTTFLDLGWAAGPGVAVLGLSHGSSEVRTVDFRIDPGGPSVAIGYRVRVF